MVIGVGYLMIVIVKAKHFHPILLHGVILVTSDTIKITNIIWQNIKKLLKDTACPTNNIKSLCIVSQGTLRKG